MAAHNMALYKPSKQQIRRICRGEWPNQHGHPCSAPLEKHHISSSSSRVDGLLGESAVHDHLGHEWQLCLQEILQLQLGTPHTVQVEILAPRTNYQS